MHVITLYPSHVQRALESTVEVIRWLISRGVKVQVPDREDLPEEIRCHVTDDDSIRKTSDLIISLGGDGTLLGAARFVYGTDIPLLGINLGSLGFLTETPMTGWQESMNRLLEGRYSLQERMLLSCSVRRGSETVFSGQALNDVVIHRGMVSRLLHLSISINDRYAGTYASDGLIISTPTGSTAYSLSAGGPIVSPDVPCLILTAICPHTLSARPLVISEKERVLVRESHIDGISLSVDGHHNHILKKDDDIMVERAPRGVTFIQIEENFYGVVREKLKWVSPHT